MDHSEIDLKLQAAIGRIHYLSTSLPTYPSQLEGAALTGLLAVLEDVEDTLNGAYEEIFSRDVYADMRNLPSPLPENAAGDGERHSKRAA